MDGSALLIILVISIAMGISYTYLSLKPKIRTWPEGISPVINWPVLLSPEVQVCLPNDKPEAIRRYRKQANVGHQAASDAIEYLLRHPDRIPSSKSKREASASERSPKPIVPLSSEVTFDKIDWDLLLSLELQECINTNKIEAVKRYRQIAQVDLKDARDAVEYYVNHRDEAAAHIRIYAVTDEQEKSIRSMLRQHQRDEAVSAYQSFSGVDEATAQDAVTALQKELRIERARMVRIEARDPRFD